ncbi:MAG: TonB-dependent receptor [Pseudomonadota bacterium]|nr:TonB-dependent receptor [Pseudomonadota bacterium]
MIRLTMTVSVVALASMPFVAVAQAAPDNQDANGSVAARTSATQATTPQAPVGANDAAATDPGAQSSDIIVTGVRASLAGAQSIKRNATQVVDSIVAEDIGKLPDNTVSDALQRVTGIQVSRGAGEVGTVLVRGLPDIETLINGRETFTGTSRGVALQDIPAELVAGIDVYKTNLPEQIEGSVSGTIDIRLRRPFDFEGFQIAGGARGIYSDQRKKGSYIGSVLVSDRWQTGIGEIGILIGGSYNNRKYEDQTGFNFGFNPLAPPTNNTLIPDTVGGLVRDGNRTRPSGNVSLQWRPAPNLEFYADGLYTGYREDYDVDFFVGLPKAGVVTVDSIQSGSQSSTDPRALNVARTITTLNDFTIASKQTFHQKTDGYQANIGGKWTTGRALLTGEFTYNDSRVTTQQYVADSAYVVPRIDYNFDVNGTPNVNFNGYDFTNRNNLNFLTLFDNRSLATSKQYAEHVDLLYTFDGGFLKNFKIGARYADRSGSSAATNPQGYPIAFVPLTNYPGSATNAPDDILDGKLGVNGFALPDSAWIRNNIGTLRALAGRPAGDPAFDPTQTFSLREQVFAYYGQAAFGFTIAGVPIDGTIGARYVNTATNLNAIQVTNVAGTPANGATPATAHFTLVTPINSARNESNLLPSISLKAHPTDNVVVRFVAGKAILRPQFASLDPAISLSQNGATGTSSTYGTGAGGNANLRNVKSTNYDATVEWYFSKTGSLTVAGFYKDLNGYIQSYAANELQTASNGTLQTFLVTRPRNTNKGSLKGVEAAYTQFYDFLPGPLSGLGAQASVTYSDGKVDDPLRPGTMQAIAPLSKYSYNLVGIYEKYGVSMRLAYNWRSSYTDSYSDAVAGGRIVVKPVAFLDFSASYALNDHITLTVDATNLLDETYHDNFGTTSFEPRDTRQYDRTFGGGVRFKF